MGQMPVFTWNDDTRNVVFCPRKRSRASIANAKAEAAAEAAKAVTAESGRDATVVVLEDGEMQLTTGQGMNDTDDAELVFGDDGNDDGDDDAAQALEMQMVANHSALIANL